MSKSKYGFSGFFGLFLGMAFIIGAVATSGHADYFWNLPSAFITIGGTMASIIMAFPPKKLKTFGPVFKRAFLKDTTDIRQDIEIIITLSKEAHSKGLLALESYAMEYKEDKFLSEGIQQLVDGISSEDLRNHMQGILYFTNQRHAKGAAMMDMVASTAPSLGLLGTYVGLIPMLHSLDDPTTLGPMMALELVSSFYGAFIAYIVFSPLAKRLKTISKEELSRNELLLEGLVAIAEGKNPRLIESDLGAFINAQEQQSKQSSRGIGRKRNNRANAA